MIALFSPTALLIVCIAAVLMTGLSILHWAGVRCRYWADLCIGAFAVGFSSLGAAVYLLLLLHAYFRPAAILLVSLPVLYLARQFYVRKTIGLDPDRSRAVNDTARADEKLMAYSGIVTFARPARGKLLVGLKIQKPGVRIAVKEFRISPYQYPAAQVVSAVTRSAMVP